MPDGYFERMATEMAARAVRVAEAANAGAVNANAGAVNANANAAEADTINANRAEAFALPSAALSMGCRPSGRRVVLRRVATWAACAAVVAGVGFFGVRGLSAGNGQDVATAGYSVPSSAYADYMIDELSDYAMLDNEDFYSYVTE